MNLRVIILAIVCATVPLSLSHAQADSKGKAKATKKAAPKKGETYPLYGKVVSITSRTLTVVRSDEPDAKQSKYTVNSATQFMNGDKPATIEDVKVGRWIGGSLMKGDGEGSDTVVKINVAAKQKDASTPKKSSPKKKS